MDDKIKITAGYKYNAKDEPGTYKGVKYDKIIDHIEFDYISIFPKTKPNKPKTFTEAFYNLGKAYTELCELIVKMLYIDKAVYFVSRWTKRNT